MCLLALAWPVFLLLLQPADAGPDIWPRPASLKSGPCGTNPLSLLKARLAVTVVKGDAAAAKQFVQQALELAAREWGCSGGGGGAAGQLISVRIADASCATPACFTAASNESYSLAASSGQGVSIQAASLFGVNPALATLTALADGSCRLTCLPLQVTDGPRFPHRGILLDTARNWFSVADIKAKILDPMHRVKLNVLHWHVWDSQSQPLEVKSNPALWLPYSKSQRYTQADAQELIRYAFARGIRVLPEFDMPGHTAIFSKADPSLIVCNGHLPWDGMGWPDAMCNQPPCGQIRPGKVAVLTGVLTEMAGLFPNSIVSTGCDEVSFNCWNDAKIVPQNSTKFPAFQKKWTKQLKTFQTKVAAALSAANKTMAVWDESFSTFGFSGTPALPKNSLIFNWESPELAAAMTDAGYQVVMAPYTDLYLDCGLNTKKGSDDWNWCSPLKNWSTIYSFDLLASFTKSSGTPALLLGGEVAMWSEHLRPSTLDYVVWPRAAALAERLWSQEKDTKDVKKAKARLIALMRQLARTGLRMSPLNWNGTNLKYQLQEQWCDTAGKQPDSSGADYCASSKLYAKVPLTFGNLIDTKEI